MEGGEAMKDYREMPIDELMGEYSALANDPIVMAYNECGDELMKRRTEDYSVEPKTEFYKAACGYEYTIELPYDELHIGYDKAWMKHHGFSFTYKDPDGRVFNACLSLCGYSREDIVEMIDKRIERLENEAVKR
jgi:hypothetical protein